MFKIGDKVRGVGKVDGMNLSAYTGVIVAQADAKGRWLVNFGKSFSGHKGIHNELTHPTGWNVYEKDIKLFNDTDVKIIQKGRVVIASRGRTKGIAKCNPTDNFDLKVGIEIALERLKAEEAKSKPFVPTEGECFYRQTFLNGSSRRAGTATFCPAYFPDIIYVAMGASYRTYAEAEAHTDETLSKMRKVLDYAKTLNTPR